MKCEEAKLVEVERKLAKDQDVITFRFIGGKDIVAVNGKIEGFDNPGVFFSKQFKEFHLYNKKTLETLYCCKVDESLCHDQFFWFIFDLRLNLS